jgi:hypothetical protein
VIGAVLSRALRELCGEAMAHWEVRLPIGVTVTTSSDQVRGGARQRVDLDELFRDVPPINSIEDLAAPEVFETDDELDEFLVFVRADRNANLA